MILPSRPAGQNDESAPNQRPVSAVAPSLLPVRSQAGTGTVPMYSSPAWLAAQHRVSSPARRAVILLHGRMRDADRYFELLTGAAALGGNADPHTLLLVPQFLASADVLEHALPNSVLHWEWTAWMGGDTAVGPAPISSFEVLDQILTDLSDRQRYPGLNEIVVAGHSGGAQVVQRYAVVGRGAAHLEAAGIKVRYVVANPSSYVYFDDLRPMPDGSLVRFDPHRCAGFADWKYGLQALPDYVLHVPGDAGPNAAILEAGYLGRDVTMLLGGNDNDPRHPALDRSCAALAQGANRLERGRSYARYIALRHPDQLKHLTVEIAAVGHDPVGIFASPAGQRALFGVPRCD